MNISSLLQSSGVFSTSQVTGSTNTQNTQNAQGLAEILKKLSEQKDDISISAEGLAFSKMPPEKPDFANMSDEDLTTFLTKMQEKTGSIPGVEDGTSVSDLSSEQLQSIRNTLTEITTKMEERMSGIHDMGRPPQGTFGMQGPPPMDIPNISDDSLKTLLETIKSDTGSIPGIDDSESADIASLTDEQLQKARDTLMEMMQKRMDEMRQSMDLSRAASAYEKNSLIIE